MKNLFGLSHKDLPSELETPLDKCVNMMLAIAIGDAYGVGYEDLSPSEATKKIDFTQYFKAPHPKAAAHEKGHYTDDTQMSLAVAEAIYQGENFNEEMLGRYFFDSYNRDRRLGYSSRIKRALEHKTVSEFLGSVERSTSDGAAMRAVPFGVISDLSKVKDYAIINANTTHRTSEAIISSVAVALASHFYFHNLGEKEDVIEFCIANMSGFQGFPKEYFSSLSKIDKLDKNKLKGWSENRGLGVEAIPMAGTAILFSYLFDNPSELLKEAVCLGGDTDTLASIALGLFAARKSIATLPSFLFDRLENEKKAGGDSFGRDYIIETGKRLATILPLEIRKHKRLNYPGQKQWMITHTLDGILNPIDPIFLTEIIRRLMRKIKYDNNSIIIGIDAGGYIPALTASIVTGLPMTSAIKAHLQGQEYRVQFREEQTAVNDVFFYCIEAIRNRRIIIVDDEITTGQTVCNLIDALKKFGCEILGVVVPVESTAFNAREKILQRGTELVSHTKHNLTEET